MEKEKNVWAIAFLIAFWLLAPNQINAQQDSTQTTALDNVVVTATKISKSQTETGKVLLIIDENQIKQSAGKDLSQLLNEQAGLFVNGANSNPGKDKSVYLRGAKSDYTLVMLDGVPLNDPSSIGGGAYDFRLIPLNQIERIEILKGNQSTLYGSNAVAGVINIITKKDGDKVVGGNATVSLGSFNTLKTSASVSGSTAKLSYLLGASRLSSNGVSESRDTLKQHFEKDSFNQDGCNGSLTYRPIQSLKIEPYFRYSDFKGKYDGGPFTDNPKNNYKSSLSNVGASLQYGFKKGSASLLYGYDRSNRTFTDSSYGFTSIYRYKGRFHHAEGFFDYKFSKTLELLGGFSEQTWQMVDEAAAKKSPSVTLVSPYASLFLNNWKGLSVELGGRYNHHSKYGNNFTFSFNPSYMFVNVVKIFANVSSGFKAPSLQQLYGQFGPNEKLKPERSLSQEAGFQIFLNKQADFRVTAFHRKIEDIIYYAFPQGYINQDKQNDMGIDLESTWNINKMFKTKVFYSYVTGQLVSVNIPNKNNLYRIPRNSIGFNLQYQILANWLVSLNYRFVGMRHDLFFNNNTFNNDEVKLTSYHLVDAYAEYSMLKGKLKFFVDAKNLLNQHYYEVYGYSVLPINVQAGLNTRF